MFVRFARFEGADASNRDVRLAQLRRGVEAVKAGGAPEGAPPEAAEVLRSSVARVMMVVDHRDGTEGSAVFCATEEDLQRADQVLNAMSLAEGDGSRSDVAHYEVVLDIEM